MTLLRVGQPGRAGLLPFRPIVMGLRKWTVPIPKGVPPEGGLARTGTAGYNQASR